MKTQAGEAFCLKNSHYDRNRLWPTYGSQHLQDQRKATRSRKGANGGHEAGLEHLEKEGEGECQGMNLGHCKVPGKRSQRERRKSIHKQEQPIRKEGVSHFVPWLYLVVRCGSKAKTSLDREHTFALNLLASPFSASFAGLSSGSSSSSTGFPRRFLSCVFITSQVSYWYLL